MDFSAIPRPIRFALGFAIAVLFVMIWICALGSPQFFPTHVRDFTLCQANSTTATPSPLSSLVLTPTSVVYACGYLEVSPPNFGNLCLSFYLNRDNETVFRPDYYCLPAQSQHFSYPIRTGELRTPGKYRLYTYNLSTRNWSESVAFEIQPDSD
jgi:hypothetical protein